MPQLSYQIDMTAAIEGMVADTTYRKDTVSRVAATVIACARLLVTDPVATLGGKGVKLPDADFAGAGGTTVVEGVSMWDPSRVVDPTTNNNYAAGVPIAVLRAGRIWVRPMQAVAKGAQAAARWQNGDEGRFDLPGADAALIPSARYMQATTAADELTVLELNLPTTAA